MSTFIFSSESVSRGHPDKIADQIADAILDACLEQDSESKVACEVFIAKGLVLIAGEITSKAIVDYSAIARNTIREIGYTCGALGFDYRSCAVIESISEQSLDIAAGIEREGGAGDQGMMFGFACDETKNLMPLPIELSHKLMKRLNEWRLEKKVPYLRPDAKCQVSIEYNKNYKPSRIDAVVLSTQHKADVENGQIVKDMNVLIQSTLGGYLDRNTRIFINPSGRFVQGGPSADTGLTGRKLAVDAYGGMSRQGGGAFSGKDASKVDRSASYMARYLAKNIVKAGLARRCEIQLAYAIGHPQPVSMNLETFDTCLVEENDLLDYIVQKIDLSPAAIIERFDLKKAIYFPSSYYGHFGREEFSWEKTDLSVELAQAFDLAKQKPLA